MVWETRKQIYETVVTNFEHKLLHLPEAIHIDFPDTEMVFSFIKLTGNGNFTTLREAEGLEILFGYRRFFGGGWGKLFVQEKRVFIAGEFMDIYNRRKMSTGPKDQYSTKELFRAKRNDSIIIVGNAVDLALERVSRFLDNNQNTD